MNVVIAGGGTGGHLYPGLALADALVARGHAVTFVGTAGGIEARVVPQSGYPLRLVPGQQLRGGGAVRAVRGLLAAARGVAGGLQHLRALRPALVVGVGGYASAAVVIAAAVRRLPTVLLEQNVIPGGTNRMLARVARRICVGFAETVPAFRPGQAVHTGNPIRKDILGVRPAARQRPGLLVYGGSGGARRVNEAAIEALRLMGPSARLVDVTHQTGAADADTVRNAYAAMDLPVRVLPFIDDMGAAYAAADVVVGRAGAMTCAELTALGLPSVLVPYPYAADDHQRANAKVLVAGGAAEMILDPELSGERLAKALRGLLEDPTRRAAMAAAARALGRPDAAERVAAECLRVAGAAKQES